MLFTTWIGLLAMVVVAASAYLVRQISSLPDAPMCPACRGVTTQAVFIPLVDRLLATCGGGDARLCPRCGWQGRMRWRLAVERVRRD
jgi:hypothetical protein